MKAKSTLIILTVASFAFVGGAALTHNHWEFSRPALAASGEKGEKRMERHGWRHGGMGHMCSPKRGARYDTMIAFIDSFADLTPEQTEAWKQLTSAVDESRAKLDATCDQMKEAGRPSTAPERMARMETMMSAGLEAVQTVRPAFDSFYVTLDDEQKKAIDRMMKRRGRR